MREFRRSLVAAALLFGTVGAGIASAQTVIAMKVPAGMTVELGLNGDVVDSAKANAEGQATLNTKRTSPTPPDAEVIVTVFVDICDDARRVLVVEPGQNPPGLRAGCVRREVAGSYVMRSVTTFLVEVTDVPSLRLRQGDIPKAWLTTPTTASGRPVAKSSFGQAPAGLVLFGGAGLASFSHIIDNACGGVSDCSGHQTQGAWTVGVTYWLSPFLGVETSYLQPGTVDVTGQTPSVQSFGTTLDSRILTIAGKIGGSTGRARVYAQGGATYGWSLSTVAQVVVDRPVDIDGTTVTIVGGSQKFQMETKGWGWGAGGGLEIWVNRKFGVYGEFGMSTLKGKDQRAAEGRIDERIWAVVVGARFRVQR